MEDLVAVRGIVLKHTPYGEYDWVVTIFTSDRGKITAFAKGARKPGNRLCGVVEPFCFGTFKLFQTKTSYNIADTDIENYFEGFRSNLEEACYGTFFLELASYYTRENNEDTDLLNLLYISLKALLKSSLSNVLVRCIFEIRCLQIEGEYPGEPANMDLSNSARYALNFIVTTPLSKLFTFTVTSEVERELALVTRFFRDKFIDRPIKSMEMLSAFDGNL